MMSLSINRKHVYSFDQRRCIAVPGDKAAALNFSIDHFIAAANQAIDQRGAFYVALSGGSTPKAIYQALASDAQRERIDWKKVYLFWSDERAVPPDHPDSNYRMAMENGLNTLPIPEDHIFRMAAEETVIENALAYERTVRKMVPDARFDLVMLGMGDDGHTASLFPYTQALHAVSRLAVANYLPDKRVWRMSLTTEAINRAHHIAFYVFGANKAAMLAQVFGGPYDPLKLPSQAIGTPQSKALWITDKEAAAQILCV